MQALRIVKGFDVIKKQRLSMIAIERYLIVETFAFESRPKTFHDGVIVTIAFSAHAGLNLVAIQELAKVRLRRIERLDPNDEALEDSTNF